MDSAANLNKDTVHTGLKLTMDDQGAIKKQAAAAAEAEEHLLNAETAKIASTSRPHTDPQNPDLDLNANNFEETINIRMEDIYHANPANTKYKKKILFQSYRALSMVW
jgi:tRNA U54 and U55 pseudouridine synthase Pus10